MNKLFAASATAALALGMMAATASSAQAGSNNWGDNGFGACTSLGNSTFSDQSFGACVQSLSGWVSVEPWTIYNATPTCEDTLDGPYPVSSLYPTWANTDEPQWVFSGQAWYNGASMDQSVSAAPGGGTGAAWQGSGIDSDIAEDIDAFYGDWDGNLAVNPSWGTGITAFGNPDLFETYSAQYALACLEAQSVGIQPYSTYASSLSVAALGQPKLRVSHNPRPAERKHTVKVSEAPGDHVMQWRRITLVPKDKRKVTVKCPSGYERIGQIQLTPEHAPKNMKAPTKKKLKKNKVKLTSRAHKAKKAVFTVKTKKLSMTTMVNAHLRCGAVKD